jgi:hypothetical protein
MFSYSVLRLFLLIGAATTSFGKVMPVVYEGFEICVEPEDRAGVFDFSDIEIFAESDTDMFVNGTWKFLKTVKSPWKWIIFTEKFERNQWNVEAFNRVIPDFCQVIQNQNEPWHFVTKNFKHKNCPFPAGVSWTSLASAFAQFLSH